MTFASLSVHICIFRHFQVCQILSQIIQKRHFFWDFFNYLFSSKKTQSSDFHYDFWWVYWSETQKKMKNINLVTLWLHISFSDIIIASQKMPNFSLEKLRRQQSWCVRHHDDDEKIYQKEGNFRCWWSLLWLN